MSVEEFSSEKSMDSRVRRNLDKPLRVLTIDPDDFEKSKSQEAAYLNNDNPSHQQ